jgi:hypothetical protein
VDFAQCNTKLDIKNHGVKKRFHNAESKRPNGTEKVLRRGTSVLATRQCRRRHHGQADETSRDYGSLPSFGDDDDTDHLSEIVSISRRQASPRPADKG